MPVLDAVAILDTERSAAPVMAQLLDDLRDVMAVDSVVEIVDGSEVVGWQAKGEPTSIDPEQWLLMCYGTVRGITMYPTQVEAEAAYERLAGQVTCGLFAPVSVVHKLQGL